MFLPHLRILHNVYTQTRISVLSQVLLDGMAGSTMGIWVAHGEGRADFSSADLQREVCGVKELDRERGEGGGVGRQHICAQVAHESDASCRYGDQYHDMTALWCRYWTTV